jgi:ankyrin repeat protein
MLAISTPGRSAFEDPLIDTGGRIEFAARIPAPDPKDPAGGAYGYHQGVLTGMSVGPLTWAAFQNRPQLALRLVQRDRRVEPADRDLLYFAATFRHWDLVVGALPYVERKNVDAANGVGVTPLMLAARDGNLSVVQALLGAGAKVNARSNRVWVSPDASFFAAFSGHGPRPPDLVGGYTALRAAKERGHSEVVGVLAQAGGVE